MTGTGPSASRRAFPRPWIYLLAAPIVLVMTLALVNDPGRIGRSSGAVDLSIPAFVTIALVMTALMGGVWAFSRFRYRTVVLIAQVAIVWVGGVLYAFDVRTHVTYWDVAEDAVLLVTTLLQLLPGDSTKSEMARAAGHRPGASEEAEGTDRRSLWERLRRLVGLLILAWTIFRNYDNLTSGQSLPTFAALALIAFVAWLFLRPRTHLDPREATADQWRAWSRGEMTWWALWTLTAAAVVTWAGVQNGFRPASLVFVAVPLVFLLGNTFAYAKAEAITARAARSSSGAGG